MKAIINANIILENEILREHCILFEDKIVAVERKCSITEKYLDEIIDAEGRFVSAGFIDIHIHGCANVDTMDEDVESLQKISRILPSTGVTSFLATTMTMPMNDIERALANIKIVMMQDIGAEVLGCHLEGPFINTKAKGAHDETYIIKPDLGKLMKYRDVIKIITLAPELEGSSQLIKTCIDSNIIVSIGHTQASYDEAFEAIKNGALLFTHLFNAMPALHHRNPGTIGAAIDCDAYCELIADNIHLHPAVIRIMIKAKGTDKVILITDAMRACLNEDGIYDLGGLKVSVQNNEARLPNGKLAGSMLTINKAIKNIIKNTGIDIKDAIKFVTGNPSKLLGINNKKGAIAIGMDADLTIFDEEIKIYHTFVKGKMVYRG